MHESVIPNKGLFRYVDLVVDRIIMFTDYFIITRHVTLSETTLFSLGVVRGVWQFIFGTGDMYGVTIIQTPYIAAMFCIVAALHIASFFISSKFRVAMVFAYGFLWAFLGILYAFTVFPSVAVPKFFILALLAVFIGYRLLKDDDGKETDGIHD